MNDVLTQTQSFFEATGQMATSQVQKTQGAVDKHFISYLYDGYGNLDTQTVYYGTGGDTTEETYQYDVLHRLTSTQRVFSNGAANQTLNYDYDAVGNFTLKDDYATSYDYGVEGKNAGGNAGPNAVRHVSKIDGTTVNFTYDNNGNMLTGDGKQLDYNAFNKPILISAGGIESEFFYGTDISRYKQVKTGGTDGTVITTYVDKLFEKVVTEKTGAPNTTEYKHYIGDVAIITKKETSGETFPEHTINYTLRDRLGSVVTLTNHQGDITEFRSYDAFGKPRQGSMENVDPAKPATLAEVAQASSYFKQTNRGFTDHEHLDDAELIHMNGRAYDYNLGRFLSVDPFIQEPGNSQSMNPYSYIMNNPLAGTDPSGYVANWGTKSGDSSDGEEEPPPEEPPEGCQTNWCAKVTYDDGSVEYVVLGNGSNTSNSSSTDDVSLAPSKTSNYSSNAPQESSTSGSNASTKVDPSTATGRLFNPKSYLKVSIEGNVITISGSVYSTFRSEAKKFIADVQKGFPSSIEVDGNMYAINLKLKYTMMAKYSRISLEVMRGAPTKDGSIAYRSHAQGKTIKLWKNDPDIVETSTHEFMHILGFGDTYKDKNGKSETFKGHKDDIMGARDGKFQDYHAKRLIEVYGK